MKQPTIAKLSPEERKEAIDIIKQSELNSVHKALAIEAIEMWESLVLELSASKLSINRLKHLLGFRSEQLKKLYQTQ